MMGHLSEDDLVLHRYGESPDAPAIAAHLATCEHCRAEAGRLNRVLAMVDLQMIDAPEGGPEPSEGYGREVWARIQDRLEPQPKLAGWSWRWLWPQLAFGGAVAAMLFTTAQLVSRVDRLPSMLPSRAAIDGIRTPAAPAGTQAERVLMAAVGEHFDRSEMLLTEFNNVEAAAHVDMTEQQAWAEDLAAANRLYRVSASQAGNAPMVDLLDQLERVFIEVAHGPQETTGAEVDRLRQRLDTSGVLFKLRVVGSEMRGRQAVSLPGADANELSGS